MHQIPQYHNTARQGSHFVGCGGALSPAGGIIILHQFNWSAFPPGFYLLREGWVHCPAPEAPLTRGMPKGPRVFLTNSRRVWATALRIKYRSIIILHLFNCQVALRRQVRLGSWIISFGLRGPSPQAFTPFWGGLGSLPGAWGAPNKGKGIFARRAVSFAEGIFDKLRARVGYGPAPGPTQKKALCHTCP